MNDLPDELLAFFMAYLVPASMQRALHQVYLTTPQIVEIAEALAQYYTPQTVAVTCRVCRGPLVVVDVVALRQLWVLCPSGCTGMHLDYDQQYITEE